MPKNEWALITGASSGIGKAFAQQLAQSGTHLYMIGLEADDLLKLASDWSKEYGIETHWRAVDLSQAGTLQDIVLDIQNKGMDVSTLVNAAGFGYFGEFTMMSAETVEKMIKVNVLAVIELCHAILPKLKARGGGTIINIASIAGHLPYPYAAVYAGSKSMVHYFTKALWAENKDPNINIVSLSPGHTRTNFDHVSKEPDSIHLFPDEDPNVIAKTTLARVSSRRCTIFTHPTHVLKIMLARLLPIKVFAWLLSGLMKKGAQPRPKEKV